MKTQYKHLLQRTYLVLVFGFMYLPIAVLIAYSFNENKSRIYRFFLKMVCQPVP